MNIYDFIFFFPRRRRSPRGQVTASESNAARALRVARAHVLHAPSVEFLRFNNLLPKAYHQHKRTRINRRLLTHTRTTRRRNYAFASDAHTLGKRKYEIKATSQSNIFTFPWKNCPCSAGNFKQSQNTHTDTHTHTQSNPNTQSLLFHPQFLSRIQHRNISTHSHTHTFTHHKFTPQQAADTLLLCSV